MNFQCDFTPEFERRIAAQATIAGVPRDEVILRCVGLAVDLLERQARGDQFYMAPFGAGVSTPLSIGLREPRS